MADYMMDLDGSDKFPELDMDRERSFEDEALIRSDTNILNLEADEAESELLDGAEQQMFDDQGSGSDEDPGPELSPGGVLDEETVAQGLSNLGRSADGVQFLFLHLALPGYNLIDLSLLAEYVHLQKVEIPYNELTDLSALNHMPYLLELDASHNKLTTVLDFIPPKNLKIADFSYNQIEEIGDLSAHHYLMKLVLDHNGITEIKGIERCTRLHHLSVSHNKLEKIQGLDSLPINNLNLSCNEISKIDGISSLKYLQKVDFSGNKIRSMEGLENHEFLESVDLEDNEIIDLAEVIHIQRLKLLRQLNLQRNPIRELPDYRLSILFHLQQIGDLDRHRVTVEEKVAATNMFNPPLEVLAARDHIMHVVYNFLQPSKILDSTLPSIETPYPMLVLVGPQGAGKKGLAQKLVEEFPDYFGYGISHTTRKPFPDEMQDRDYHFCTLEEFEDHIKMGKFLQTYSYHGELYGLTIDAIEAVAREGLACVVHMELEGVLTLKNSYFEPRYVLIMPLEEDTHDRRLRERNVYSEAQIAWTIERDNVYAEYNREHPGFFDMMIPSDDILDGYRRLRRLVMDYLGISAPSPSESVMDPSTRQNTELSTLFDRENTALTTDTQTGVPLHLARTWSKPSLNDSMNQAIGNLKQKTQSPMPQAGRGVVEKESLRRRQSAAKDAVTGHTPSIYEQILQRGPRTAPQLVSAQLGLGDDRMTSGSFRACSAPVNPNMDGLPPGSPDSSESGSHTGSSLTNISEARDIDESPDGSEGRGSKENLTLPAEALDRIELMSGSASKVLSNGSPPYAPRPGTGGSRPGSGLGSRPGTGLGSRPTSGRPGSDRHPILPPIGQKTPPPDYITQKLMQEF